MEASMSITRDSLQIARLEEQFSAMRHTIEDMAEAQRDMREALESMKTQLDEARGGWRTLLWLGGASATLGASVSWVLAHVRLM